MKALEERLNEILLNPCTLYKALFLAGACGRVASPAHAPGTRNRSHLRHHHLRHHHLRHRGEEGAAMVEMAVVLPILLLIVTAIYSFGIALNNYLQLTDGVAIGARLLAVSAGQTTDPCAVTVAAIEHAAPTLKTTGLTFSFVLNGTTYPGTSCSSSSITTGAAGNMVAGQPAQVTVTYPCNLAVYGKNYAPTCTMVAQTTEIIQ